MLLPLPVAPSAQGVLAPALGRRACHRACRQSSCPFQASGRSRFNREESISLGGNLTHPEEQAPHLGIKHYRLLWAPLLFHTCLGLQEATWLWTERSGTELHL